MNRTIKILSGVLTAILFVSVVCGCAPEESEEEEIYQEDKIVPIEIEDTWASDRVIETGFAVDTPVETASAFTLPYLVGNNMLLQANMTTKVWGKTTESGKIAVQVLNEDVAETTYYGDIEESGDFLVYLGAHDYGTGFKIRIVAESGKCITLNNVAFGELYVGGGQSNMGWTVGQCYDGTVSKLLYAEEVNSSTNSDIRLFAVTPNKSTETVDDVVLTTTNGWSEARPQVVRGFSAVGYFFARELNMRYDVPVGIIQSCMGGTPIHTWLPDSVIGEAVGADTCDINSQYFNGMIYPIRNAVPRGILWYQGEGDHNSYDKNYTLLMKGWREMYGKDNIWFSTVQLPRYTDAEGYFLCREQQKAASVADKYATYSVNIDCGLLPKNVAQGDTLNPDGIHPYDKLPVGERLAHATMARFYGAQGVWRGPVFKSAEISGNKIIVTFSNVGKGLVLSGMNGFEIGEDKKAYVSATVKLISKNQVEISAEGVENPDKVRYGCINVSQNLIESYAECVCLYNTKGEDNAKAYPAEQFVWKSE